MFKIFTDVVDFVTAKVIEALKVQKQKTKEEITKLIKDMNKEAEATTRIDVSTLIKFDINDLLEFMSKKVAKDLRNYIK